MSGQIGRSMLAVMLILSAVSGVSLAQWGEQAKFTAPDAAAGDRYGQSVGISGNASVVGATGDDDNGSDSGAAYVLRYGGSDWSEEQKLTASDAAAEDRYGQSVEISGNAAVLGATGDDDNGSDAGAAYILRYGGSDWSEEQKLTASDAAAGDRYGQSVEISGNAAVVGATGDDDNGSDAGAAYILRYGGSDWIEEQKLTASNGVAGNEFGFSSGICGDVAVIGRGYGSDAGSAYVFRFNGLTWMEEQELLASDGATSDQFGLAVATSGDTIIVGAPYDADNGSRTGAAYIFRYNGSTWVEEQKLTASDGEAWDEFGLSVDISGETAIVGAWGDWGDGVGNNTGAAYVFRYNGSSWVEEAKLMASDGAAEDELGVYDAVAISGDIAMAGAHGHDGAGNNAGAVYVFEFNGSTWIQVQKLLASDAADGDGFGSPVDLSGGTAIIGASGNDDDGVNSGSAYVFHYNGSAWVEEQNLTASDAAAGDGFGRCVAVSGETVVVGAAENDDDGADSGSVYMFRSSGPTWIEEQKLTASNGVAGNEFGFSSGICGDVAVIGRGYGSDAGSAYVFRFNGLTWMEEQELLASDGATSDQFGLAVATSGDTIIVGAPYDADNGSRTGAAYIFRYNGSTWVEEQKLTASDGEAWDEFGLSVDISGETAIVGAWGDWGDGVGNNTGAAYVFRYNGSSWVEEAKLMASDGAAEDELGVYDAVAISGDIAMAGAHGHDGAGNNAGAVYVFEFNGSTWIQVQKLLASDAADGDGFGSPVDLSGGTAIIGASGNDDDGVNSGSAYVFHYNGSAWVEEQNLTASDAAAGDGFGRCVAVSGETVVVGAAENDDDGADSGSVYMFGSGGAGVLVEVDSMEDCGTSATSGEPVWLEAGTYTLTVVDNPDDHFDAYKRGSEFDWRWEVNITVPGVLDIAWNPTGLEYPTAQEALAASLGMSMTITLPAADTVYFWISDLACGDNFGGVTLRIAPGGVGEPPDDAPPPHDVGKNRYISFDPNNAGTNVAFLVELAGSEYFPGSVGVYGWVGEPDGNNISRVVRAAHYSDAWPAVVHVGDCMITPVAEYAITSTTDGIGFSESLTVNTIAKPGVKYWGDVVGGFNGTWEPPNGVVNMSDIQAILQAFSGLETAPHLTWVDLDAEVPNKIVNMTDVQRCVSAFKGEPYPFSAPADCP